MEKWLLCLQSLFANDLAVAGKVGVDQLLQLRWRGALRHSALADQLLAHGRIGDDLFHIRIQFRDEQAAYYQYHVFPPDLDYITGWSRKREGASQLLILHLHSRKHLEDFIAVCRRNPHFVSIEEISEEEFWKAQSHAV